MDDVLDPNLHDEPERDPALGRLLGELDAGRSHGIERHAATLADRVMMAAAPALTRLREADGGGAPARPARAAGWWEWIAGWSPAAVPLSLAVAALVFTIAVRLPTAAPADGTAAPLTAIVIERSVSDQTVLAALSAPSDEAADTLVGPATGEWLLAAAMQLDAPGGAAAADAGLHSEDSMATGYDDFHTVPPSLELPATDPTDPGGAADSGGVTLHPGSPR